MIWLRLPYQTLLRAPTIINQQTFCKEELYHTANHVHYSLRGYTHIYSRATIAVSVSRKKNEKNVFSARKWMWNRKVNKRRKKLITKIVRINYCATLQFLTPTFFAFILLFFSIFIHSTLIETHSHK
jgi:hypothetical protein